MAAFTLPKNSKINAKGKRYSAPAGAKNVKAFNSQFKVYRWSPDDGQNPRYDTYEIDLDTTISARWCWTLLSRSKARSTRR